MELDRLIIIIGPSAVGKTTIANGLAKEGMPVEKVITTTSRSMRASETDGVDYHFVSAKQFEEAIAQGGFLEWAKYNDNYYGSRKQDIDPILQANKIPVWVTESKGADYLKAHYPHAVTIFVMPADFETLRRRLEKRKLPKQEIINRIKLAQNEMLNAPKADYRVINYDGKIKLVVEETASLIRKHFNLPRN